MFLRRASIKGENLLPIDGPGEKHLSGGIEHSGCCANSVVHKKPRAESVIVEASSGTYTLLLEAVVTVSLKLVIALPNALSAMISTMKPRTYVEVEHLV